MNRIPTLDELVGHRCRRWRGKSGQIWYEVKRVEDSVTLVPEYEYFDSNSRRGAMTIPIRMLLELMQEIK